MVFLPIRKMVESVIAVAEPMRSGCPARQPSPKEVPLTQNSDCCFLACLRDHGEFYPAGLDIKHRIGGIPLSEDSLFPLEKQRFPVLSDGREKCLGIENAVFLSR